jgi:transcriptional regulator with XRE-family HTH domain
MAGERITIQQAFGHELRRRRVAAGFSQEQLALNCGLDRTFISLLERGLRQPTLTTLFILADTLQVKPSKLIASVETQLAD